MIRDEQPNASPVGENPKMSAGSEAENPENDFFCTENRLKDGASGRDNPENDYSPGGYTSDGSGAGRDGATGRDASGRERWECNGISGGENPYPGDTSGRNTKDNPNRENREANYVSGREFPEPHEENDTSCRDNRMAGSVRVPEIAAPAASSGREFPKPCGAPITGWLAFFLWVGVGVGGAVSLCMMLKDIFTNDYSLFYIFLRAGSTLLLAVMAAYAIRAFYRRLPDAVAAARTYIVMVLLDGVVGLLIAIAYADSVAAVAVFRQFVWVLVWSAYLSRSVRVRELFPPAGRCWRLVEKYALALFSVCYLTVLLMGFAQTSTNVLYSSEGYIRQTVEATREELPLDLGDGVQLAALSCDDRTIRYVCRLTGVDISEFDVGYLMTAAEETKQEMLDEWPETMISDEFLAHCCRQKLIVVYEYYDRADKFIYVIVITPEEYKDRMYELGVEADKELWE